MMRKHILPALLLSLTGLGILVIELIINNQKQSKMFTVEQVKTAHSKVKSGADFPAYIQEIKKLGVTYYETFVADGHTDYYGTDNHKASTDARHSPVVISEVSDVEQFKADLKAHQQGKTDYPTFLDDCVKSGVAKWVVRMDKMTVTYYNKAGNEMLVEEIPQ